MPRYRSSFDLVAELLRAEHHMLIEHMRPCFVKGNTMLLLDHTKEAKAKRYPRHKRHISHGHLYVLATMHHHINAPEILHLYCVTVTT